MPRKRKTVPKKIDDEKRQKLTWNMSDVPTASKESLINDVCSTSTAAVTCKPSSSIANAEPHTEQTTPNRTIYHQLNIEKELCSFGIGITHSGSIIKKDFPYCKLGEILAGLPDLEDETKLEIDTLFSTSDATTLFVSQVPGCHLLVFESKLSAPVKSRPKDVKLAVSNYFKVECSLPFSCFEALRCSSWFLIQFRYVNTVTKQLELDVYLTKQAICRLHYPCEFLRLKKTFQALKVLIDFYYGVTSSPDYKVRRDNAEEDMEEKEAITDVLGAVKNLHSSEYGSNCSSFVQHEALKPMLRAYQQDAVCWMIQREKLQEKVKEDDLHILFEELKMCNGELLYYNKYLGILVEEKPLATVSPPGGILADEMGLGKTVEVLAVILLHPRSDLVTLQPLIEQRLVYKDRPKRKKKKKSLKAAINNSNGKNDIGDRDTKTKETINDVSDIHEDISIKTGLNIVADNITDAKNSINNVNDVQTTPSQFNKQGQPVARTSQESTNIWIEHDSARTMNTDLFAENHCDQLNNGVKHDTMSSQDKINNSCDKMCVIESAILKSKEELQLPELQDHQYVSPCSEHEKNIHDNIDSDSRKTERNINGDIIKTDDITNYDINKTVIPVIQNASNAPKKHGSPIHGQASVVGNINNAYTSQEEKTGVINIPDLQDNMNSTCQLEIANVENDVKTPKYNGNLARENRDKETNTKSNETIADNTEEVSTEQQPYSDKGDKQGKVSMKQLKKNAGSWKEVVDETTRFECICGVQGEGKDETLRVQCVECGLWQHPECLNYDLKDPLRQPYKCPHCHIFALPMSSKATLIISPSSICHQWVEEILKHVKQQGIKVHIYNGVKTKYIQPWTLANQDIVVCTYETLRTELNYVDLPHSNSESGRRLRNPKRFMAIPSPIIAVEWWRVCLDEAQMVECVSTKAAEMVLRLRTVNRWCVTGTPIQKGIKDLYGLFVFLGRDPYWVEHWWNTILYQPYCHGNRDPLHTEVARVMWRTAKADVIDQINIPDQREEIHWLTFSPVEEHFYRRQFRQCVREAMQRLCRWTDSKVKLSSLDRYTMHQLLLPLVKLRQACCHPQAVRGEFLPIHKSMMTMEELLKQLTKKTKTECEEAHRQIVAAHNGLAALYIAKQQYEDAVEEYREVLRSVEEHKDQLRTDELQQLHAMYNLNEVLALKPSGIAPTLRDDQLVTQCEEIKRKYLKKAEALVTQAQEHLIPAQENIRELSYEFAEGRNWWIAVLDWSASHYFDDSLLLKVREDLQSNKSPVINSIIHRFRNVKGLQLVVHTKLEELQTSHDQLVSALKKLSAKPSPGIVNTTVECCLRPVTGEASKTCPFCKLDEMFNRYEAHLFSFVDQPVIQGEDHGTTSRRGTWADSEVERVLKSILAYYKLMQKKHQLIESGNLHIKIFESLKKEFRHLRAVWMVLREQVAAIDELSMATTRLRLRLPDEPVPDPPQPNIIEPAEFEQTKLKQVSDKIVGKNELRKSLSHLLYLQNLSKNQGQMKDNSNPELCPICQLQLGKEWSVLQCGHCFCLECIRVLVEECPFGSQRRRLKCPMCRQFTRNSDIAYVSTGETLRQGSSEQCNKVKGDHSTKVIGVVSCLMNIQKTELKAKVLIFSTWVDILTVIGQALSDNGITHVALHAGKKSQINLSRFKAESGVDVLLLPIHSGANGLNLIEATHVFLVEPILNPGQELQAIGRVHRIGQTRATTVHRFLVRGTIEEKMHAMLKTVSAPVNTNNAEDTNFTIGDLSELFQPEPDRDTEPGNGSEVEASSV
ncbi:unnamed protein product [Owenia fusiformis]|uniref:E3 ubiquitin-protein ligase SHPRH n=1 Tax=Owenia fusiformis TaxID=6347 RepID=A0A8S4Q2V3_OWEFU|nr:unnamed protein product [Owenia fusiformis]